MKKTSLKVITLKDFNNIASLSNKVPVTTLVKKQLAELSVNQALVIPKSGWTLKTAPIHLAYGVKGRKHKTKTMKNGWAILRTA